MSGVDEGQQEEAVTLLLSRQRQWEDQLRIRRESDDSAKRTKLLQLAVGELKQIEEFKAKQKTKDTRGEPGDEVISREKKLSLNLVDKLRPPQVEPMGVLVKNGKTGDWDLKAKSNRQLIKNAITYTVLAGPVNQVTIYIYIYIYIYI